MKEMMIVINHVNFYRENQIENRQYENRIADKILQIFDCFPLISPEKFMGQCYSIKGFNIKCFDYCNFLGDTVISKAASVGNYFVIAKVVSLIGTHLLNVKNNFGYTPLGRAAKAKLNDLRLKIKTILCLIELGADVNSSHLKFLYKSEGKKVYIFHTPLILAAENDSEAIPLLLRHGARYDMLETEENFCKAEYINIMNAKKNVIREYEKLILLGKFDVKSLFHCLGQDVIYAILKRSLWT